MKRTILTFLCVFSAAAPAFCEENSGWLPKKKLFTPFFADLTQPAFALRYTKVSGGTLAEVNLGDEFGIYRRSLGGGELQFGLAGGAAARFDISKITNDYQIADYSLVLPADYVSGQWAFRAMYWHTSSHLGDDYIKRSGIAASSLRKHVTDDIRLSAAYSGIKPLRLYAGAGYAFNLIPKDDRRLRFQAGVEAQKPAGAGEIFAAADIQALERLGFRPSFCARAGIRRRSETSSASAFAEFFAGRLPYLGFMTEAETHWSLGLSFEM